MVLVFNWRNVGPKELYDALVRELRMAFEDCIVWLNKRYVDHFGRD